MSYPNDYTVFDGVPSEYPSEYSQLTDDVFIWNSPVRTLTSSNASVTLSQDEVEYIKNAILNDVADLIHTHDIDIKVLLNKLVNPTSDSTTL